MKKTDLERTAWFIVALAGSCSTVIYAWLIILTDAERSPLLMGLFLAVTLAGIGWLGPDDKEKEE